MHCRSIDGPVGVFRGTAPQDLRRHNRGVLLNLIRSSGRISRAQLARASALSMATVLDVTRGLLDEEIVREVGEGRSTGGRRPILLELIPDARFAIGLEVGSESVTAVITDINATVRYRVSEPSRISEGATETYRQLRKVLLDLKAVDVICKRPKDILGIGLAFPAPQFSDGSHLFTPPNHPEWKSLALDDLLAEEFAIPVVAANDAQARAVGEYHYGVGKSHHDMFYIVCHEGVGGAAIMDGHLRRGASGGAGEIGHMVIDVNGPSCPCGRNGCLETYVGQSGILRQARQFLGARTDIRIGASSPSKLGVGDVASAAWQGDASANAVLRQVGRYLGIGIANVVNCYGTYLIVIGGPTISVGGLLLQSARQVVKTEVPASVADHVQLIEGQLGMDSGAIGSASLVLAGLGAVHI